MGPQVLHLPDGQNIQVTPVFAGLFFKWLELTGSHNAFPTGWTIVIHTADDTSDPADERRDEKERKKSAHFHSFTRPTLQRDSLFISSLSTPASSEWKPAASPTRQIAMMLWVTLYWYFHQPAPDPIVTTENSKGTPESGRPHGEWRVRIKRDGVLKGRNLIPKLERMGLIACYDSAVGTALDDNDEQNDPWSHMYVSRKMFWQIPGRLFLFSLQPSHGLLRPGSGGGRGSYPASPATSRPGSPSCGSPQHGSGRSPLALAAAAGSSASDAASDLPGAPPPLMLSSMPSFPIGPFFSASHLPTYYPPPPLQYVITNHVRHPLRPKPPRMGEVFYTRFVPSVGQYLSFRVASISPTAVPYLGPVGPNPPSPWSTPPLTTGKTTPPQSVNLKTLSDSQLLKQWHDLPRVSSFWGPYSDSMLPTALRSRHSFPVIGLWDGVPFGYFEIYWVKEDLLGRYIGGDCGGSGAGDWDRGIHVLVGEEWARGRVQAWLSSLVHWVLTAEYRTQSVCVEPRVDNCRYVANGHCSIMNPISSSSSRVALTMDGCIGSSNISSMRAS